jgi:hypothetical protein
MLSAVTETISPPRLRTPRRRVAPALEDRRERLELGRGAFTLAVAAATAGALGVMLAFLTTWPPHEDEALALFVGRHSLGDTLDTVLRDRGGAPLHFVLAWAVVHLGGRHTELRLVSALFAVASVPLIALLGARLAGRAAGAVAAFLSAATWLFLFHGIYGRMYSLFLFTSTLTYLALLWTLDTGGRRRFALWGAACVVVLATHPYGLLVVGSQVLFVLLRRRHVRETLVTLGAVVVVAIPFWLADLVLRERFDVGFGGGGAHLGSFKGVLEYLRAVARDMSAGPVVWRLTPALLLAVAGFVLLVRRSKQSALMLTCAVLVPSVALALARLRGPVSPETRHFIFLLPFFTVLLALPIVELARFRPGRTLAPAVALLALLLAGDAAWAVGKVPRFFNGEAWSGRPAGRQAAADWLARTHREGDVYFGYEPVFLRAWEENAEVGRIAVPRADPQLAAAALKRAPQPLGRGVWVFDAGDTTNTAQRRRIAVILPKPEWQYEARAFGPYLVIRSRWPVGTPKRFLRATQRVMDVGIGLDIGDADWNLHTALLADDFLEGLAKRGAVPPGRAARPEAASSVAPIATHYRRSLRPGLGTSIAPRRRATFHQPLLAPQRASSSSTSSW